MKTRKMKESASDKSDYAKRHAQWLWDLRKACWKNACDLLEEAELLFSKEKYSRAFFLGYTALEELGKYLFVCDYITGLVSEEEFRSSFSDHGNKIAYAHNNIMISTKEDGTHEFTLVYDKTKYKDWMVYRNNSLYIGLKENQILVPKIEISEELATKMIERAKNEKNHILTAEGMNEIIGSKAFYKQKKMGSGLEILRN